MTHTAPRFAASTAHSPLHVRRATPSRSHRCRRGVLKVAIMPAVRACLLLMLLTAASPAAAQWTRVTALPASDIFSVWAGGDTVTAGADTAAYVSTDAGATWKR